VAVIVRVSGSIILVSVLLAAVPLISVAGWRDETGETFYGNHWGNTHRPKPGEPFWLEWGYADTAGECVIACQFGEVLPFSEGLAAVRSQGGYYGTRDTAGVLTTRERNELLTVLALGQDDTAYSTVGSGARLRRVPPSVGCSWGYIDRQGVLVVPFRYSKARSFCNGFAAVESAGKWHFIDHDGHVVGRQFESVGSFGVGTRLAAVVLDGKAGYIDTSGNTAIAPQYEAAFQFSGQVAIAALDGHYGLIDARGAWVVTPVYDTIRTFREGVAAARLGTRWVFLDTLGAVVLEPGCEGVSDFSEGMAAFRVGGKSGFIDRTGRVVVKPSFDQAWHFSGGTGLVKIGETFRLVDRRGRFVNRSSYADAHIQAHEGLRAVASRRRVSTEQLVYPDIVVSTDETRSWARPQHRPVPVVEWAFVDSTGRTAIAPVARCAEDIGGFCEGRAKVTATWGSISGDGTPKLMRGMDTLIDRGRGVYTSGIADPRCSGFIDRTGKLVRPFRWARAGDYSEGLAPVGQYTTRTKKAHDDYTSTISAGARSMESLDSILPETLKSSADTINDTLLEMTPFVTGSGGMMSYRWDDRQLFSSVLKEYPPDYISVELSFAKLKSRTLCLTLPEATRLKLVKASGNTFEPAVRGLLPIRMVYDVDFTNQGYSPPLEYIKVYSIETRN
jgi:hypothetical protein